MYCPISGCGMGGPITLAANRHQPINIAIDADAIYWADYGLNSSATDGTIMKIAKP
jgi:hypothetical protein